MIPLVAIRPEPGLAATIAAARAAGLEVTGQPLFEIKSAVWQAPDPGQFDGLLIGSANAVRHAGTGLDACRHLPAHVVGHATAEAARAAGLRVGMVGQGGLQAVLDAMAGSPARLLRLAGRERVALNPPPDVTIAEAVVYASEPVPLPADLAVSLANGALVLLHSGEAAQHFAAECDRLGIARAGIALAALAPRIAEAAGPGWRLVAAAPRPDEPSLLALAGELCQTLGPGMEKRVEP